MSKASNDTDSSCRRKRSRIKCKSKSKNIESQAFRDELVEALDKAKGKLEATYKALDAISSKPKYQQLMNTCSELLLDVLYTGDLLSADSKLPNGDHKLRCNFCVFSAPDELSALRVYEQLIKRLRRGHKKLDAVVEMHARRLLTLLGTFEPDARRRLALLLTLLLIAGQVSPQVLVELGNNQDNIDTGLTLEFMLLLCDTLKREKDSTFMLQILKVSGLDGKILNFMPPMMRSDLYFRQVYQEHDLNEVIQLHETYAGQKLRRELQARLVEDIREKLPHVNVVMNVRQFQRKHHMSDSEIIGIVWQSINSSHTPIPNGKLAFQTLQALQASQLPSSLPSSQSQSLSQSQSQSQSSGSGSLERMLRKLHGYAPLLNGICSTVSQQIALLIRLQEWCHEHNPLFKQFEQLVVPLYQAGVFDKEAILRWFEVEHVDKGTPAFLDQMLRFVQWLRSNEDASCRVDYNTYVANRKSNLHRNPTVYSDSVPGKSSRCAPYRTRT